MRLIAVDEIDFLRSDEKYTLIGWRGDQGKPVEALIRTPLKELLPQLDPVQFAQVHRSVVVNLRAISHVKRGLNETADIHLKGRDEVSAGQSQLSASVPSDVMCWRSRSADHRPYRGGHGDQRGDDRYPAADRAPARALRCAA